MDERITVAVLHFDKLQYIDRILTCLENQTIDNFDVIFLDDHWNMDALEIVKKCSIPLRYCFLNRRTTQNEYLSIGSVENYSISHVFTKYYARLDGELLIRDTYLEEMLANHIAANKKHRTHVANAGVRMTTEKDMIKINKLWPDRSKVFEYGMTLPEQFGYFMTMFGETQMFKTIRCAEKYRGWGNVDMEFLTNLREYQEENWFPALGGGLAIHQHHKHHGQYQAGPSYPITSPTWININ